MRIEAQRENFTVIKKFDSIENPQDRIILIPYTTFWALLESHSVFTKPGKSSITSPEHLITHARALYKRLSTEFGRLMKSAKVGRAPTFDPHMQGHYISV